MPSCTFYHPNIPSSGDGDRPGPYLSVPSGLDEASWSLSCNIGELTITGTLPNYRAMERVYSYFAYYLQIATQGRGPNSTNGTTSYNQQPMTFTYPERGWSFKIMPTALRRFKYGNDIVAPSWGVTAHIVDHSNDLHSIKEFTKHQVLDQFLKSDGEDFDIEGKIGFLAENPFSADGTIFGPSFDADETRKGWEQQSDRFNEVIDAYLDSDIEALYETLSSRPAWGQLYDKAGAEAADQARQRADEALKGK
jgi:hypothetical protein